MIQVGGESNSYGFCLVLLFFYFPTKVTGDHVPGPLITALERVRKAVISVCKNDLKELTDASYGCGKDKKTSWFSHI